MPALNPNWASENERLRHYSLFCIVSNMALLGKHIPLSVMAHEARSARSPSGPCLGRDVPRTCEGSSVLVFPTLAVSSGLQAKRRKRETLCFSLTATPEILEVADEFCKNFPLLSLCNILCIKHLHSTGDSAGKMG
jgi:hypothetical protein